MTWEVPLKVFVANSYPLNSSRHESMSIEKFLKKEGLTGGRGEFSVEEAVRITQVVWCITGSD